MSSTHSFHLRAPIKTKWWDGTTGSCATLEFDDCRIDLFAHGEDMRERLKRSIDAFEHEMQREPVAQAVAAE